MGVQVPPADIEAPCDTAGATPKAWVSQPHAYPHISFNKNLSGQGCHKQRTGFQIGA